MQNRSTKEQGTYDNAVEEFLANGGRVSKCQPALAKGAEARRDTKRLVSQKRAEFRRAGDD